jgi:glutaminyl-peptide cyclotransferase
MPDQVRHDEGYIVMRLAYLAALALLAACQSAPQPPGGSTAATLGQQVQRWGFRIVATHPHDRDAFTQGLLFHEGFLYESTGLEGRSTIRRVNIADGRVLQSAPVPQNQFGEGITLWGNEIRSLTWRDQIGYRWDRESLRLIGSFRYPGEGWGLTTDGAEIIMSDGTDALRFLDPATMEERRRIRVTDAGQPLDRLNELEWVNGEVFANVWMTGRIARINPQTGAVTGWIDLEPLVRQTVPGDYNAVLNGIAHDPATGRLWVTGKNWPRLYQIELVPAG